MKGRGAAFILAAITMLFAALSTGSTVYLMMFSAMALMLGLSLLSVIAALFSARVTARSVLHRVERGGRLVMTLNVKHRSLFPIKAFRATLSTPDNPDASGEIELSAPPMRGKAYEYMLSCPHRGTYRVGVTQLRVTDVFELFSLTRKVSGSAFEITVTPRAVELAPLNLQSGDTGPETIRRLTEDAASPSGIRTWQEGDPLKRIHWKLSIRKRELMVRTYEESARPDTLILVDLSPMGMIRTFALSYEDAICETAASVAQAQLSASYPVRMPLTSARPQEVSGQVAAEGARFIDALSRVQFDSPYTYEQVLTLEMRRMQRTGGIVLITARLTARIADIAVQMRRTGVQVRIYLIADTIRPETDALISRMLLTGITASRVSPWDTTTIRQEDIVS